MKNLLLLFIVLFAITMKAQTRIPDYPVATSLSDSDYVVINKSDSVITKIIKGRNIRAAIVKDSTVLTTQTVKQTTKCNVLVLHMTGTIAALTVVLPVSPLNGQEFTIVTDHTVTALTLSGGTTVSTITTVTTDAPVRLIYDTSQSKWFTR